MDQNSEAATSPADSSSTEPLCECNACREAREVYQMRKDQADREKDQRDRKFAAQNSRSSSPDDTSGYIPSVTLPTIEADQCVFYGSVRVIDGVDFFTTADLSNKVPLNLQLTTLQERMIRTTDRDVEISRIEFDGAPQFHNEEVSYPAIAYGTIVSRRSDDEPSQADRVEEALDRYDAGIKDRLDRLFARLGDRNPERANVPGVGPVTQDQAFPAVGTQGRFIAQPAIPPASPNQGYYPGGQYQSPIQSSGGNPYPVSTVPIPSDPTSSPSVGKSLASLSDTIDMASLSLDDLTKKLCDFLAPETPEVATSYSRPAESGIPSAGIVRDIEMLQIRTMALLFRLRDVTSRFQV